MRFLDRFIFRNAVAARIMRLSFLRDSPTQARTYNKRRYFR